MRTIYKGELATKAGRRNAWADSFFVDHAFFRLAWTNFAAVEPGQLYRSNHPTPANLAAFTRRVGLKSLINLRGQTGNGSDALSRDAAARLGLDFYDLPLDSRDPPARDRILRLAEIYRTMQRPALIHCKSGADRAGLAAAVYVLLQGGAASAASRQLSWRFLHIRQSKTGVLDAFIQAYAVQAEGSKLFLDWVREDYDKAALQAAHKTGRLAGFVNDTILKRE